MSPNWTDLWLAFSGLGTPVQLLGGLEECTGWMGGGGQLGLCDVANRSCAAVAGRARPLLLPDRCQVQQFLHGASCVLLWGKCEQGNARVATPGGRRMSTA